MKRKAAVFLLLFAGICLASSYGAGNIQEAQTLTWDLEFRIEKTQKTVEISPEIRMETGETVVITVTPATECFAYVLLEAEQEFLIGYNGKMNGGKGEPFGIRLEDPPGTEKLHIIMSLKPQTKLENLLQAYNSKQNIGNRENILKEIASLQDTISRMGERPGVIVPSGGTMRGGGEEIATRFSDQDMYVKTIKLLH